MDLKDKNIIVTGGSLGIGRATADLLVKKGANVLITGRSQERLKLAAEKIKFKYLKFDIGDIENQWLTKYCRKKLETNKYNYFIFGHSHIPVELNLNSESKYINLGDWITNFTYAEFDGNKLSLKSYKN